MKMIKIKINNKDVTTDKLILFYLGSMLVSAIMMFLIWMAVFQKLNQIIPAAAFAFVCSLYSILVITFFYGGLKFERVI